MLAGRAYHGPFAIPLAEIASPIATATVLITAVVCMNTGKTDTKYLIVFIIFRFQLIKMLLPKLVPEYF